MRLNEDETIYLQNLVGHITEDDLECVEYYLSKNLGIFIPSVGFCKYAIKDNHTHPSYSFIISFTEENFLIKPTQDIPEGYYFSLAMSPKIPHVEEQGDDFNRYIAIFINKEFFEKISGNRNEKYFWKEFILPKEIMIYLKKFMKEYQERLLGYNETLNALGIIITNEIARALEDKYSKDTIKEESQIEISINYMEQNFGRKISVSELASLCNMSESYFIKRFKEETKSTPIEYLINIRLKKAKMLLMKSDLNITEVALQCGFYSVSHFSSCFYKEGKITPSKYRKIYSILED